MSRQSLKTIIQEANERQEAKRVAADRGMTLMELAEANGWRGTVEEFIGVLVSHGSLFDDSFAEQLPSLQAHLADRGTESLKVMTEVVNAHLDAIAAEIEAGMYEPSASGEGEADFGELLEAAVRETPAEGEEESAAEAAVDAADSDQLLARADELLEAFTAESGGAEEAEELLAGLMDEETPMAPLEESEDLLAEMLGEMAGEASAEAPVAEEPAEVDELAAMMEEFSAAEEALAEAEEPVEVDELAAMMEELPVAEEAEPEVEAAADEAEASPLSGELDIELPVEAMAAALAEGDTAGEEMEAASAEVIEEEEGETMVDLMDEEEALPDYLASYLDAAEPAAEAEEEGDILGELLGEVEAEAEEESEGDMLDQALDQLTAAEEEPEGEEALADLLAGDEEGPLGVVAEEPVMEEMMAGLDEAASLEEMMAEPAEEALPEMASVAEEEAPMPEMEPVAEAMPEPEEMPEMEEMPPLEEAPAAAAAEVGEEVRVVAERYLVMRDGEELYAGLDKGDAAMVLREAFLEHGLEGLELRKVTEREVVRTETVEENLPFSFSVDVKIS